MTKPSATGVTTVKLSAAIAALAEIPAMPATVSRRSVLAAQHAAGPRVEQAVGCRALEVARSGEPTHQVADQVDRRRRVEAQPAGRQLERHHVGHRVTGREVQDRGLGASPQSHGHAVTNPSTSAPSAVRFSTTEVAPAAAAAGTARCQRLTDGDAARGATDAAAGVEHADGLDRLAGGVGREIGDDEAPNRTERRSHGG